MMFGSDDCIIKESKVRCAVIERRNARSDLVFYCDHMSPNGIKMMYTLKVFKRLRAIITNIDPEKNTCLFANKVKQKNMKTNEEAVIFFFTAKHISSKPNDKT
jgi:hypothetical protein